MTAVLPSPTAGLSATGLAAATVNDPQFRPPDRPGLVPGVVTSWLGDRLVVEGTGCRRVLSGRSARRILPDLLPILDGTRTAEQLAEALGQGVAQVRAVLTLLYSCGLLQDGPVTDRSPRGVLLARLLDTTRVHRHVTDATARLDGARVWIAAPPVLREPLRRECLAVGIGSVSCDPVPVDTGSRAGGRPGQDAADLAVVWVDGHDPVAAAAAARRARHAGVPVLLAGGDEDALLLGPYSAADYGACPDCHLAQASYPTRPPSTGTAASMAAQIAIEVVTLLARVGTPVSLRGRAALPVRAGQGGQRFTAPRPGCPECGDPAVPLQDPPTAYEYEAAVAFPPRRLVNPRDHQHHFETANVALQFDRRHFPEPTLVALPLADPAERGGPADRLTVGMLATLLAAAFGVRDARGDPSGKPRRWAPTGGNLGSPTAYMIVRDVEGLPAGRYVYEPFAHALARVDRHVGGAAQPGATDDPSGVGGPAAAVTLVTTGALARVARKYRTFAYRVVHLDAGVALAHLRLLGRRLDLDVVVATRWDDDHLAGSFGIDQDAEAVTGLVHLTPDAGRNRSC